MFVNDKRTSAMLQNSKPPTVTLVAEMSRPKRKIQQWLKERKTTYCQPKSMRLCRQKTRELATTTNWFQPILWAIISEVARIVGRKMSPIEIVRRCKGRSNKLFHRLRADVVRKWIGVGHNHVGWWLCLQRLQRKIAQVVLSLEKACWLVNDHALTFV